MRHLNQSNQRVDLWLPGVEEKGKCKVLNQQTSNLSYARLIGSMGVLYNTVPAVNNQNS